MYGIWNGEKFLVDDYGKPYTADTPEFAEAQMQFFISGGARNLEVRRILPDLSDIFPKRSQCRCSCHSGSGVIHMAACCVPD